MNTNTDLYGTSLRSSSMVLLALSLAVMKRSIIEFCFLNALPEEDNEKLLKSGIGLLKGEIKPERYEKELEEILLNQLTVEERKNIVFEPFVKDAVVGRLSYSYGTAKNNKTLK